MSPPLAATPRGGQEFAFRGITQSGPSQDKRAVPTNQPPADGEVAPEEEQDPFAGLGPWLEGEDVEVYNNANNLVLRQELIALNHLAIDTHYTRLKLGFPFSILTKDDKRSQYTVSMPAGTRGLSIQAVPNKAWDLVNKATETILVDPPQPDPTPLNDSEEAEAAAEMCDRFLTEDGSESGTNDIQVFYNAVDKGLVCASGYVELFTNPVAGGYVPLQILAHPQATDAAQPLIGPEGMPTPDPILRYVTAPEGGQFTDDPSQAAPQWQPNLQARVWGSEHWRIFPEDATVDTAQMAIGLLYCTIAEAKQRFKNVEEMEQQELDSLTDWTPTRYLVLLPPFQRARWKVDAGGPKDKTTDERIIFFYKVIVKACPASKHGAEVYVTGAFGGRILDKKILSAVVQIPASDGTGPKTEVQCMDLPLIQFTPRADPDERDPRGRPYIEMFCGATEFDAALGTAFLEALDLWLHPDTYIPSTSTVQGFQVAESRATGDAIPITRPEDKPTFGNQPPLPPGFFDALDRNQSAIESIASLNKPVTGADNQAEVSGKARIIAVRQAMVGLARMQHPIMAAVSRYYRIKTQLAKRDYTTEQMVRYVGEDGAYKVEKFQGVGFALVGDVSIRPGTGTMLPPEQKVQYLGNLQAAGMLPADEASEAARPAFAKRLGLPDNPHQQFIERCVALWLDGPSPEWLAAFDAFEQAQQVQEQAMAQVQAQGIVPPEGAPAPAPLVQPPPSPFPDRPNDTEPAIAALWVRRLSKVMSTVKFSAMPLQWQQPLNAKYGKSRDILAMAQQQIPQPGTGPNAEQPKKPQAPKPNDAGTQGEPEAQGVAA